MKGTVFGLDGKQLKEIQLPAVFDSTFRPDLIRRAVHSIESAGRQPYGPNPMAGRNTTALFVGARGKPTQYKTTNVGHARLPRTKDRRALLYGRVARVPQAVKGANAHPAKPEKRLKEKINKKEKKLALNSAIAATANEKIVLQRGHKIKAGIKLPVVVEKKLEELKKTKEVLDALEKIGLGADLERAKDGKTMRAGKGKRRGRRYKKKKSVLIVVGKNSAIQKAARNIEGVEIIEARNLNAKILAPGGRAGRLTVWSEGAINFLGEKK